MPTLLNAALAYAAAGWRVLPTHGILPDGRCTCLRADCPSIGKLPAIKDWVTLATVDPARIKRAWAHEPNFNIGIATGTGSGITVLDIDTAHGGEESLKALPPLADTLCARTGGGGWHYVYRAIPGARNKAKMGGRLGIDLRSEGGQIVVAPSRHKSGRCYEWVDGFDPARVAEAPEWLAEMALAGNEIAATKVGARDANYWRTLFANGVAAGNRNDAVSRMAGHLLRQRGLDPLMVLDIMRLWNKERVVPPLDDNELVTTVNSIANKQNEREVRAKGGR